MSTITTDAPEFDPDYCPAYPNAEAWSIARAAATRATDDQEVTLEEAVAHAGAFAAAWDERYDPDREQRDAASEARAAGALEPTVEPQPHRRNAVFQAHLDHYPAAMAGVARSHPEWCECRLGRKRPWAAAHWGRIGAHEICKMIADGDIPNPSMTVMAGSTPIMDVFVTIDQDRRPVKIGISPREWDGEWVVGQEDDELLADIESTIHAYIHAKHFVTAVLQHGVDSLEALAWAKWARGVPTIGAGA
jgi:hypothetical protein